MSSGGKHARESYIYTYTHIYIRVYIYLYILKNMSYNIFNAFVDN